MTSTSTAMTSQTLSQCLSQGRIPVAEALRYSMMLAEALRKLHEGGRAHGAVSPMTINLTATGLELLPAPPIDEATSYKSPEVLEGQPADARSDIFSFGAVVYEMLSGKRAFEGAARGAMAPSGSPAVDRLVSGCMAPEPAARIQRIQKVMLELKLLAVSAARAATPVPPRRDPDADAQLLAAIEQVESRILARVQAHEDALSETQHLAGEVLHHDATAQSAMRTEFLQLEVRMANRMKASEKVVADIQTAVSEAINREPEVLPDFALRSEVQQITRASPAAWNRWKPAWPPCWSKPKLASADWPPKSSSVSPKPSAASNAWNRPNLRLLSWTPATSKKPSNRCAGR